MMQPKVKERLIIELDLNYLGNDCQSLIIENPGSLIPGLEKYSELELKLNIKTLINERDY